jgi:hypothetical protein
VRHQPQGGSGDGATYGDWNKASGLPNSSFDKARKELLEKELVLAQRIKEVSTENLLQYSPPPRTPPMELTVEYRTQTTPPPTGVCGGVEEYGECLE